MKQLKIKDNTQKPKKDFDVVSSLTKRIENKTLEQLEQEGIFVLPELVKNAEDLANDQMILKSVNQDYWSSNVMGFLGYGDERLIIESRFSIGEYDYFFQYLLEQVLELPNVLRLETDADKDNRFLNLLLFLFPHYLKSALRKGVFKTYIWKKYNDSNVRGTVNIARHIRKNIPFIGNISYDQREFSCDNYLVELIRHTIEFIKTKHYANHLLQTVKEETSSIIEVTKDYEYHDRRKIIDENKRNPIRHAYYHEYRALQRLCIMILQHQKHQIGFGVHQINGILFDGAWLWEEYVNLLISDLFYHPRNKGREGAQRLFSKNIGLIYPDFISRNKEDRIIADAKYKPIENIGREDYQQVLAYMFRFDSKKGYYLYPEKRKEKDLVLRMNSGITYESNVIPRKDVSIIKCGLCIPNDAENYEEFTLKMKESESQFIFKISAE